MLPTLSEIEALHKKYAPSSEVLELVLTHSRIVGDITRQLIGANNLEVNAELVRVGCLLHDIGVYPLFGPDAKLRPGVHYITHGIEGEAILRQEGFPETMWRFASHHTGVGLSAQDVVSQGLPLPVRDYLAETDEEALIMYADKFHSKTEPPYFNSFDWYAHDVAKFGMAKAKAFKQLARRFGKPDLKPIAAKYHQAIR